MKMIFSGRVSGIVKLNVFFSLCLAVFLSAAGCSPKAPAKGKIEFSGPPQMTVHYGGRTFKGSPVVLRTVPGKYNFRFSAPGFYSRFSSVEVRAGETNRVNVELEPVVSAVLIDSVPRGAKVKFRGAVRGATPLVISDLPAGEYSAQLLSPGYAEQQVNWKIINGRPHPRLTGVLQMISGRIDIRTVPDSARIFINGKETGIAPFSGMLDAGIYNVRVEYAGFNPHEEQVTVVAGKTVSRRIELDSRPGKLEISSVPGGAEIFIEDKKIGVTPWVSEGVAPGNYKIKLVLPGYDTSERVVSVAPARTEKAVFDLEKSTGSASFVIRPAGVSYLIDGTFAGVVAGVGTSETETHAVVVENLSPGEHILTVTHPRAKPLKRNIRFSVSKGKRYTARENIELWVANCEITFKNGKVETGMIYSESESDIYYSPTNGIKYPVSRSYIRKIKYLPLLEKSGKK